MLSKFKIIPEQQLLIDYIEGDVSFQSLMNFHLQERNHQKVGYVKKVLSNILNANFLFSPHDIANYTQELKITSSNIDLKWSILTNSARPTALSQILKEDSFFFNKIEVFSTLEAACQFLQIPCKNDIFNQNGFEIVS